jgi:YD repeat-containing protein
MLSDHSAECFLRVVTFTSWDMRRLFGAGTGWPTGESLVAGDAQDVLPLANDADRPLRVANLAPAGATLSSFNYRYDKADNSTRVTEATGSVVTLLYDNVLRLTRELRAGVAAYALTHTYDAAGNRTTRTDQRRGSGDQSAGQLCQAIAVTRTHRYGMIRLSRCMAHKMGRATTISTGHVLGWHQPVGLERATGEHLL